MADRRAPEQAHYSLLANIARPTPAAGWLNREHFSLLDRLTGRFDMVLMLAVIHHLILREQLPLAHIGDLCASLTRRWLVLEWVPPSDPMYQEWLRGRDELYGHLTEDDLLHALAPFFAVSDRCALANGRVLLLFERIQPNAATDRGDCARGGEPGMIKGSPRHGVLPPFSSAQLRRSHSSAGDERMRVPVPLTNIALAQITDLVIVALSSPLMAILRRLKLAEIRWILMACFRCSCWCAI